MLRQTLLITFRPERAWDAIGHERSPQPVMRHLALLALVPAAVAALLTLVPSDSIATATLSPLAADSPFGLALREHAAHLPVSVSPAAEHASAALALAASLLAYAGTWIVIAAGALVLHLLLPLFSARRNLRGAMALVAYSATPLLLSSIALLNAALVPVMALAAMHSCYIAYLGLPALLKVPRAQAGVCVALSTLASLVLSQAIGYAFGVLHALLQG